MMQPLYLDYAATTPLDPSVAARMREVQESGFANPASNHAAGRKSAAIVEHAAGQLAALLNTEAQTIIWTSGATESNNLALAGAAHQRSHRGRHLVTMRTEHKAVVDVFRALEKQGFDVSWLEPDEYGLLSVARLQAALRDDTQLVSVMHINNETGVAQDIAALGGVCRDKGICFHVDGAQAAGKVVVNLQTLPVDLYSLTAHKFYGPKGIGALIVADGTFIEPLMFGGGQQRRLRPGTLPVDLIAGLGAAASVATEGLYDELVRMATLRQQLWNGIRDLDGIYLNGLSESGYPGILNVGIDDIEGESLLLALEPLCVATGSACNAKSQEPSYVLRALGRSDRQAQSAIRFSLGRATSQDDIAAAIDIYRGAIHRLRALAPRAPV